MSQVKWTSEMARSLVELYELHPVLYKVNSPNYHNKVLRCSAVQQIRGELEKMFKVTLTESEVLKKINNLRSQFLECLRKHKKVLPSGSKGSVKPVWWLYESMQFLLPYCCKDKGQSNLAVTHATTTVEVHAEGDQRVLDENLIIELPDDTILQIDEHENPSDANSSSFDAEGIINTNLPSVESQLSVTSSGSRSIHEIAPPSKKRKTKQSSNAADIDDCIKNAINTIVNENNAAPKTDVKAFCDFIESELSEIKNKKIYKRAKWSIINIIKDDQEEDDDVE